MSTLRVAVIETAGVEYTIGDTATTLFAFDQTPVSNVDNSVNITSITDSSTGLFVLNYTTAYRNANYYGTGQAGEKTGDTGTWIFSYQGSTQTKATTGWSCAVRSGSGGTLTDIDANGGALYGNLA